MEKKVFKCKQFDIDDSRSALKIGTDGMMLGAWANAEKAKTILDIGTGSGLMALMQAQKYTSVEILGIDIDEGSILDAKDNAKNSKWESRLNFICQDIKTFTPKNKFDFIISNPPFFINSTKSKSKNLSQAKHTDSLSPKEIIDFGENLLTDDGTIAMILPFDLGLEIIDYAKDKGYTVVRSKTIYPVSYKKPNRLLFELTLNENVNTSEEAMLCVRDSAKNNAFSDDYKTLLSDFMIRY